jgi:hypothetical protein
MCKDQFKVNSTRLIDRERFLASSSRGVFELYVLHVHIFAILSSLRGLAASY